MAMYSSNRNAKLGETIHDYKSNWLPMSSDYYSTHPFLTCGECNTVSFVDVGVLRQALLHHDRPSKLLQTNPLLDSSAMYLRARYLQGDTDSFNGGDGLDSGADKSRDSAALSPWNELKDDFPNTQQSKR